MGAEPQQYKHEGNFPPTTILSRFLRDPEPEVEWYINEIDNVGPFHIPNFPMLKLVTDSRESHPPGSRTTMVVK